MSIDYSKMAFPKGQNLVKKARKKQVSKDTYQKVFDCCNGKCVLCGKQTELHLHHVLGRGKNVDNYKMCVMLCANCHLNIVHKNQKKYRPILKEMCERIYK